MATTIKVAATPDEKHSRQTRGGFHDNNSDVNDANESVSQDWNTCLHKNKFQEREPEETDSLTAQNKAENMDVPMTSCCCPILQCFTSMKTFLANSSILVLLTTAFYR